MIKNKGGVMAKVNKTKSVGNRTPVVPIPKKSSIFKKWWFWLIVGSLVAMTVVVAIALSQSSTREYENKGVDRCRSRSYVGETLLETNLCMGPDKPILYLYPTTTTNVSVTMAHPENIDVDYPTYNAVNGWQVTAHSNGDLYDKDGKYYYGLYWDEINAKTVDFSTGFYVTKDSAADFLEDKLSQIGLNDRERNEFIMYWLPKLEHNGQSVVYFELTDERQANNALTISPKPDSLLRINMYVKKVDKSTLIEPQALTRFERHGFSAVEWGGTEQ
jgi:hypothetical protein